MCFELWTIHTYYLTKESNILKILPGSLSPSTGFLKVSPVDIGCMRVQACPTLWDPVGCSPPGSYVHGFFSRQEFWSRLPFPPPGDLPNPGMEPTFPVLAGGFFTTASAAAKSLQSCPTLCDPRTAAHQGSPVPGILQARTLECVAISFSNEGNWKVKVKSLSRVRLLATPWTVAHQAPLSMGFSRQEYWSGVPLPSPFTTAPPRNPTVDIGAG